MKDLVLEEYYTIRELKFTCRQMIWITRNLYDIRLGGWPVMPGNYAEIIADTPTVGSKQILRSLHTRPAQIEKAAQIAAEIDWRLGQCKTKRGDYGLLYLEVYMYKEDISEVAKRHNLDPETVIQRIAQVLKYISGWKRKGVNLEYYKQRRTKGYGQRK